MGQMIKFEMGKIVRKRIVAIGILLILGLNLIVWVGWGTSATTVWDENGRRLEGKEAIRFDQAIASEYEGQLTDDLVKEILGRFKHGEKVNWNSIYNSISIFFCDEEGNYNGDTVREVFPYYEEGPSLGYGYGWTRFINNMMLVMICLGCLVVVAVSPSFSDEYSRGMDALILTSRLGCTKCPRAKAIASMILTTAASIVFSVMNLGAYLLVFGTDGWNASAQLSYSGIFEDINFPVTYLQVYILASVLWTVALLLLNGMVLLISSLCKTPFMALAVSLLFYLPPGFINGIDELWIQRVMGILPARSMLILDLIHGNKIHVFGMDMMFWWIYIGIAVVLTAAALWGSKRVFCRHQVV